MYEILWSVEVRLGGGVVVMAADRQTSIIW